MVNVTKNLSSLVGVQFADFLSDLYQVHRQVNEKVFQIMWTMLLEKYPATVPYLTERLGGDRARKWAQCYQVDVFTCGMVSSSRGEALNRVVKMNMNRSTGLLKLFEELHHRLVRKKSLRAFHDVAMNIQYKSAGTLAKTTLPSVNNACQDNLTPYGFKLCVKQMGNAFSYNAALTTMDNAFILQEDYMQQHLRFRTELEEGEYDEDIIDLPGHISMARFVEDNNLQHYQIFSVSLLPTVTGYAHAASQSVCLYRKDQCDDGDHVFDSFFCTCGYSKRFGVPCRHFFKVLLTSPEACFHLGYIHEQWFKVPQALTSSYPLLMVHNARARTPSMLVSFCRPDILVAPAALQDLRDNGYLPADASAQQIVSRIGELRQYGTLMGAAKKAIEAAVVAGKYQDLLTVLEKFEDLASGDAQNGPIGNPLRKKRKGRPRGTSKLVVRGKAKRKLSQAAVTIETASPSLSDQAATQPTADTAAAGASSLKAAPARMCSICQGIDHNKRTCGRQRGKIRPYL
jgi:hypothetical protein